MSQSQLKAIKDKLLSQASSIYVPEDASYISEQILPLIGVVETTGSLAKYGTSHLRIEKSLAGGKGKYRRVEPITRSTTDYKIESHGLEGFVSADDYRNVQKPYDAEKDETLGLTSLLWVEKEKLLADTLGSTSILTQNTTLVGGNQLSDYLNSDPLAVFDTARLAVRNGCGAPPNAVIMEWAVYQKLRYHPQILDALGFKENRPGGLSYQEIASALDVKKVLIASAMYESAAEGQASALAPVWDKDIIFAVLPDKASPYQVSLGYRVQYSNQGSRAVYKQPSFNPPGGTEILVDDHYDFLISNVNAAYLIEDAIA